MVQAAAATAAPPTPERPEATTDTSAEANGRPSKIPFRSDRNLFPVPEGWTPKEEGEVYLGPKISGNETPATYDASKHKTLSSKDFENEANFMEWKASELEKKAADLRKEAELVRKLGSSADRKKVERMDKMQEQMLALCEQMGPDVDFVAMFGKEKGEALNALLASKKAEKASSEAQAS